MTARKLTCADQMQRLKNRVRSQVVKFGGIQFVERGAKFLQHAFFTFERAKRNAFYCPL